MPHYQMNHSLDALKPTVDSYNSKRQRSFDRAPIGVNAVNENVVARRLYHQSRLCSGNNNLVTVLIGKYKHVFAE